MTPAHMPLRRRPVCSFLLHRVVLPFEFVVRLALLDRVHEVFHHHPFQHPVAALACTIDVDLAV